MNFLVLWYGHTSTLGFKSPKFQLLPLFVIIVVFLTRTTILFCQRNYEGIYWSPQRKLLVYLMVHSIRYLLSNLLIQNSLSCWTHSCFFIGLIISLYLQVLTATSYSSCRYQYMSFCLRLLFLSGQLSMRDVLHPAKNVDVEGPRICWA